MRVGAKDETRRRIVKPIAVLAGMAGVSGAAIFEAVLDLEEGRHLADSAVHPLATCVTTYAKCVLAMDTVGRAEVCGLALAIVLGVAGSAFWYVRRIVSQKRLTESRIKSDREIGRRVDVYGKPLFPQKDQELFTSEVNLGGLQPYIINYGTVMTLIISPPVPVADRKDVQKISDKSADYDAESWLYRPENKSIQ